MRPLRTVAVAAAAGIPVAVLAACHIVVGIETRTTGSGTDEPDGPSTTDATASSDAAASFDGSSPDVIDPLQGCNVNGQFGNPFPLMALNTPFGELSATLSNDEREILFVTTSGGAPMIRRATRALPNDPFGASEPVSGLLGLPTPVYGLSLAPNGSELYLSAGAPSARDIYRAVRTSASAFGPAEKVTFPEWTDTWEDHPFVGPGGLFFAAKTAAGHFDLFRSAFNADGGLASPTALLWTNTPSDEIGPVSSPDDLHTIFARRNVNVTELYEVRRTTIQEPFSTPILLQTGSTFSRYPVWLSVDGCRLYFIAEGLPGSTGAADLFVARRPL